MKWSDRVIAIALLGVMGGLLALNMAARSDPGQSDVPAAASTLSVAPLSHQRTPATSSRATKLTGAVGAAGATTTTTTTAPPPPLAGQVTAVGDSILLDIQPYLQADLPGVHVDGVVSRQFGQGIAVVQADRSAGTLGRVLVIELGTNGPISSSEFDQMMQAAAGVARVVVVNVCVPRPWEAQDNAVLAAGVARYPGVAVLADWYSLACVRPQWFAPDQVHLEPAGAQAMASLIAHDA